MMEQSSFRCLAFERLLPTEDGSDYVTDSQAVAVEIYQPRDKNKSISYFGPNKLAGAPVDLSGSTNLGPIIRTSNGDLFRLEFSDEANGQIESVVPLSPEEGQGLRLSTSKHHHHGQRLLTNMPVAQKTPTYQLNQKVLSVSSP